jgi:nicotinate-nucleotide adenylyltransferase
MRIAFFGGSFDPPHCGHLGIANAAREALALDQVLFAPVGLQPLKPAGSSASFADRAAMVQLAIANQPAFALSLLDAPKPDQTTPNYTVNTLTELRQSHPAGTQLFLLLGADALRTFHHWHRAAEIPFLADLIVAARPNETLDDLQSLLPQGITLHPGQSNTYRLTNSAGAEARLTILPHLHHEISATHLRTQMQNAPSDQIPQAVLDYIHQHNLYQPAS